MKLQEGDKVVTLARAPHEEDEVDAVEIEDDGTADEGAASPEELEQEAQEDTATDEE